MAKKIAKFVETHIVMSMIISGIIGAMISWGLSWILPSKAVDVDNLPQKELTCTLDFSYMMASKRVVDDRLQMFYDGEPVEFPYIFSITIENTGDYSISNEDFKDAFAIDFLGSKKIVHARITKSTSQSITDEVLSNAKIENTSLIIEDFFLNVNEAFTVYIISDGKPDTIRYSSRIADISSLTLRDTPKENRDVRMRTVIFVSGGALVFILLLIGSIIVWEKKERIRMDNELREIIEKQTRQE